ALRYSRVATRFVGSVPVFIHDDEGVHPFETLNYNEFGLLIHTLKSREKRFEVGDIIEGVIGSVDVQQVTFKGEVVRTQRKNDDLFYGVKMLGPLLPKADQ
ncbi:MAG: PilZ domain-containing protein, partial [Bdellovibrionales bacterium]|nr:PilZ domain-containing protein [Bdellovibrionales bacterium]